MKWKLFWLVGVILGLLLVGIRIYIEKKAVKDVELVNRVAKLILLPEETPRVGEVTDKTKLIGQKFFERSENGDKVLIFDQALKAILYRPSLNKIIDITELTSGIQPTPTLVELTSSKISDLRVVIYNGTTKLGLASVVENAIIESKVELNIVDKKKAKKTDYEKTLLVDLTGKTKNSEELLSVFGAELAEKVPTGEIAPDADILVILGRDWLK